MYVKGKQFWKKVSEGWPQNLCIYLRYKIKEYFANLQLFGLVWTVAVTSFDPS